MIIELRPEEDKDYRAVEELTRDAFWNTFIPGCDEHLIVHNMRDKKEFVKALDFVAVYADKVVGNIIYAETTINTDSGPYIVLTFGPVSVLPEYQNQGIGAKLITHTAELAKQMGYPAIFIYGYPGYYNRLGFRPAKEYNITNADGKYPAAHQVLELYPGALNGISGAHSEETIYQYTPNELEEFERGFPPKEKKVMPSQATFEEMLNKFL